MQLDNVYILNPDYMLKYDKRRVFVTNSSGTPEIQSFVGFVHPVNAILLSLFDGERTLQQVLTDAAALLNKDEHFASNILLPLLENKEELHFHVDGKHFSFPRRILIPKTDIHQDIEKINPQSFFINKNDLDLQSWRFYIPMDALFMVNTLCYTDCVYCYADRRHNTDCTIPIKRLKTLIQEAKNIGMRSFDLTGGELFRYRHWEELISELLTHEFTPYISTKCPINLETIQKLKQLGIKKIQISIDSIIQNELIQILNVDPQYHSRLIETFKNLDEHNFNIYTNCQITVHNQNSVPQLLDFLLSLKNIKRINIGAAGFSLYRGQEAYFKYRPDFQAIQKAETLVNERKKAYAPKGIEINFSGYMVKSAYFNKTTEEKSKSFAERAGCSGNFYAMIILPDGKVTICEELYWHPRFIIGDLTQQSIEEVWHSPQALALYNLSKDMISPTSACKTCATFSDCHMYKGVCWKEILYAYGESHWDYADPKCPAACQPIHEFYMLDQ